MVRNRAMQTWYLKPPACSPRCFGPRKESVVSQPPDSPLRRRLLVLRLVGTGLSVPMTGALAQGLKAPAPSEPELPRKNDARPGQRRSGETDADPGDEPGNGRGVAGGGRSLGVTDADPSDEPGRGRGGNGVTDADPGDMPGRGRGGGRQLGPSDADPGDPPGQGRGAAPPQLRTDRTAKKA